jgi:integrase
MGIGKLAPGRYRVFVDLGRGPDGRRRQQTEVVRGTKKDAERREREIRRDLDTGMHVEPHKLTVGEYMSMWVESVRHEVGRNTFRGYEQRTRTHIVPDLGHIRLSALKPLHIEEAKNLWLRQGNRRTGGPLDPQTALHIHRVLHAAMERAVKWRLLPANPVDGVTAPGVPRKEQAVLTAEESEKVVEALMGQEFELPILVGLYCALRPTEYLALRWRDVDLDAGELRVTQNVHRVRQDESSEHMGQQVWGFWFGPAKTYRSARPVSIPDPLVAALRDWRPVQAAARLKAGRAWTDLDLVFTDARGYPLNHDRVRRCFYRALGVAQVPRVVLYALRHTSATLTLAATKDLKRVAARLGHSNESMVLQRYQHLLPGSDQEAARMLGELIKRPSTREENG